MRERLEAAVDARTDPDFVIIGRTVAEDANVVIRRGIAFAQAGADVVMNSLTGFTAEQINRIAREIPVPLLGIGVPKTHLRRHADEGQHLSEHGVGCGDGALRHDVPRAEGERRGRPLERL